MPRAIWFQKGLRSHSVAETATATAAREIIPWLRSLESGGVELSAVTTSLSIRGRRRPRAMDLEKKAAEA